MTPRERTTRIVRPLLYDPSTRDLVTIMVLYGRPMVLIRLLVVGSGRARRVLMVLVNLSRCARLLAL